MVCGKSVRISNHPSSSFLSFSSVRKSLPPNNFPHFLNHRHHQIIHHASAYLENTNNGVAVPQMPPNFRGRPFTMDVMTGLDLPYNDRNKVTHTNIQQLGNRDLLFRFYDLDKLVGEETLSPSAELKIICSKDMITIIEENKVTMGEAVHGVVTVSTKLSLSEDDSLILDAMFNGTDRYIFNLFSKKYTERYIIKFGRIDR